jgi:hypothetical protein
MCGRALAEGLAEPPRAVPADSGRARGEKLGQVQALGRQPQL